MPRSEQPHGRGNKRTPADACEQAAELYLSIADGEADGYARGTARLLGEAAARCRERRGDAPRAAGSVEVTPRALPVPELAVERPSASKLHRLIRAAQAALAGLRRAGVTEGQAELEQALVPFTPGPRAAVPAAAPKRRGRPPKQGGMKRLQYGAVAPARGSRKDDPAVPHGMDDEPLELEPVDDDLDLDELRTVNE